VARDQKKGEKRKGKGIGALRATGSETLHLVIDYVKQETLEPLKGLGRFVLFGVAGSVALSAGLVILSVSFLRLLQTETGTTFAGHLSWVPYVICALVVVGVAALAVRAVSRGQNRPARSSEGDAR
jgi:Putative Actinobacterial Holin-X, holin superfamily III